MQGLPLLIKRVGSTTIFYESESTLIRRGSHRSRQLPQNPTFSHLAGLTRGAKATANRIAPNERIANPYDQRKGNDRAVVTPLVLDLGMGLVML